MSVTLLVIALFSLAAAAVAVSRKNLIHAALLLIANWLGIAAFYLWAGAEFLAFAQVLVYAGAVSMVVLFAVLLTRQSGVELAEAEAVTRTRVWSGLMAAGTVGALLVAAVINTRLPETTPTDGAVTVKTLGLVLGTQHIVALLIVGVILTVSLIGAVVIASVDKPTKEDLS